MPQRMQNGVWRAEDKIHGVVIDLTALRPRECRQKIRAFGADAVGGKKPRLGVKGRRPEFDALAQMEAPTVGSGVSSSPPVLE